MKQKVVEMLRAIKARAEAQRTWRQGDSHWAIIECSRRDFDEDEAVELLMAVPLGNPSAARQQMRKAKWNIAAESKRGQRSNANLLAYLDEGEADEDEGGESPQ